MGLPIENIKRLLAEPVPAHLIRSREGGRDRNGQVFYLDYINVYDYKDLLDERAGVWEALIVDYKQVSESMTCVVRITITAEDGKFSQDGTGIEPLAGNIYGYPFSNAYAQAFRRACEGWGLSRDLWRVDSHAPVQQQQAPQAQAPVQQAPAPVQTTAVVQGFDPIAKSLSDMVTTKQLGMIRAIAREKDLDSDRECEALYKCKVSELSRRAASNLIDHLQVLQRPVQTAPSVRRQDDDIPF